MTRPLRLAVTADLHWGHGVRGDDATRLLRDQLLDDPPDLLLLGGDFGTGSNFDACVTLFDDLHCLKALVPGNHDVWVEPSGSRGDSLDLYEHVLPASCVAHGIHYLDQAPCILPDSDLAIVGTMNWYDYSWSIERLRQEVPDYELRLERKQFVGGRHNDGRFVRWRHSDGSFTAELVAAAERHLAAALAQVSQVIVLTHHPAFYGLGFPRDQPPQVPNGLLWDAFCGNASLERLLERHAEQIPFVFSGHTHRARDNRLGPIRGHNVGGDYHFKRLLRFDWPAGTMQAHVFGNPVK